MNTSSVMIGPVNGSLNTSLIIRQDGKTINFIAVETIIDVNKMVLMENEIVFGKTEMKIDTNGQNSFFRKIFSMIAYSFL